MKEAPARTPIQCDVAQQLHQALPDSLALCEPWFGHTSLALSPGRLHFKVHVINDPGQGLVKLFEMFRIDKHALRDMIQSDDVHAHYTAFSGKSAFVKSAGDASAGIAAFRACIGNLGIGASAAAVTEAAVTETIVAIHEKLVPVLVENMHISEFITRFDRPYTVFFVPRINGGVDGTVKAIRAVLAGLHGHLIFEASEASEVYDALQNNTVNVPVEVVGKIDTPVPTSKARYLVILKRAV